MLEKVPTILSASEILDKAFLKANKMNVPDPDKYHRVRKTEEAQMKHIAETCTDMLRRYHDAFPTLDKLPSYEQEVLDILVGLDGLRQSLGAIHWAADTIDEVYRDCARSMREQRTVIGIQAQKRRFSGRCGSIMKKVDKDLKFLATARDNVRMLPTVHPEYATVVIAGFPNVGKSSLLAAWTAAKPEIAAYAFTTKAANVGHFEAPDAHGVPTKVQVVDTPGLLDRPENQRNVVEKQAVAALRHTADAVLFLIDPSETAGYTVAEQEQLLAQVRREMSGIPLVVAETKADLMGVAPGLAQGPDAKAGSAAGAPARVRISTVSGAGLEDLKRVICKAFDTSEPELELDPLELWKSKRDPLFES